MLSRSARLRRRRIFDLDQLEPRTLLSLAVVSDGQSAGVDLTGPSASPGSDGIADVEFSITGLTGAIQFVAVVSTGDTAYTTLPANN